MSLQRIFELVFMNISRVTTKNSHEMPHCHCDDFIVSSDGGMKKYFRRSLEGF